MKILTYSQLIICSFLVSSQMSIFTKYVWLKRIYVLLWRLIMGVGGSISQPQCPPNICSIHHPGPLQSTPQSTQCTVCMSAEMKLIVTTVKWFFNVERPFQGQCLERRSANPCWYFHSITSSDRESIGLYRIRKEMIMAKYSKYDIKKKH